MKVKVFHPNSHGKIEFTCAELEKLLNEIYEEGRKDCERNHIYPFVYNTPYYGDSITTTAHGICVNNADGSKTTDSIDKLTCISANATDDKNVESLATPTFTISLGDSEVNRFAQEKAAQHVQNVISNFKKLQTNDPFTMLAKELNF